MLTKKQRLEQYGIEDDIQILSGIIKACSIFGNGKNNNAKINIEKLIRHESHFGNITDHSEEYGEGLCQFDKKTFMWVISKLKEDNYKEDRLLFIKHYGFDIKYCVYEELRNNSDLSIALCRLRYKFVPAVFPSDDLGMYDYYKKWWNGEGENGGAATREKWDNDTKDCYFKSGE